MPKKKPSSAFQKQTPLDRDEVLSALQEINQRRAGLEAEVEGRTLDLKQAKESVEKCALQIYEILSAINNDRPVYRLKDGTVTTDAPDPQGELLETT